MYQLGLEYWLSSDLARTWSSGAGAGAARERALNAIMVEMRELVNCILIVEV
jgi:hypothetical protein